MGYPARIESLKNEQQSCDKSYVNNIKFKSQSAYIQAEFGTSSKYLMIKTLLDTGADFNVIDSKFLTKLRKNGIKCPLLKPERRPPVAANNQPMKLLGDCELDMRLTSTNCKSTILRKIRFQVLGNLSTLCILGINTLREIGLFVKRDTIELGGQKICQLTECTQEIQLLDSHIDENGARWGVYTEPLVFQEDNDWLSANHVDSLDADSSEKTLRRNSQEYEPSEMQAGKYLVNLHTTDDPPKALLINKGIRLGG